VYETHSSGGTFDETGNIWRKVMGSLRGELRRIVGLEIGIHTDQWVLAVKPHWWNRDDVACILGMVHDARFAGR
jgi:hypothetical protein